MKSHQYMPQTINGLMRHIRNVSNINIGGSFQKLQLKSYGYYHGYKGYRFAGKSNNKLAFKDFSEVVAVIEYDNNLKAALYAELMFVETAVKNIVCNESIVGLKDATFEYVYQNRMSDHSSDTKLQAKRLRLRNTMYSRIADRYTTEEYRDNKMIRHFYGRGQDAPIWAVFEILYLSDLANYFECLNTSTREHILYELDILDISIDTNRVLLADILKTLKALRNAVAHNNIIFDTRFKDRKISRVLKGWVEKETGINNITLYSLIDYIIVLCCILKRVDFTGKRPFDLLERYKQENISLSKKLSSEIYSKIIYQNTSQKLSGLELYLKS